MSSPQLPALTNSPTRYAGPRMPYPSIPDGVGGKWEIEKWECHNPSCAQRNNILDSNRAWLHKIPEQCSNLDCRHVRCHDCYDVDEGDYRLQHCDGAIILNFFDQNEAWEHLVYNEVRDGPRQVKMRCPHWAQTGCQKLFLKNTHAARHAQSHNPVVAIPCWFVGCLREFMEQEAMERHFVAHTVSVVRR